MIPTHLVRITDRRLDLHTGGHELWTTLEGENPGGSIKDRMVVKALEQALARGELKKRDLVSEISAGSTARSLAHYSKEFGLRCELFVPNNLTEEKKSQLLSLEAELKLCDPATAYEQYESHCALRPRWRLDQMKRTGLRFHYEEWADQEIAPRLSGVSVIIGSVGTGHSLLGVKAGFKNVESCFTVEPSTARAVNGIRNIELERYGKDDPCDPQLITNRFVINSNLMFADDKIETDQGKICVSDSFRLVLAALPNVIQGLKATRIFAVGSSNSRF